MTTIAVTGHTNLTAATEDLVRAELRKILSRYEAESLVGVSCIARGADSLFAEALLEVGGRLVVVLPSQDYREAKVKADQAALFDRLVEDADEVLVMPHVTAGREAYEAANRELLARADHVVAVWNGEAPSGNGGGTADVVLDARAAGLPVEVVWPTGSARTT